MPEVVEGKRTASNVVTGENREAFMAERLRVVTPEPETKKPDAPAAEEKKEPAKAEEKKEDDKGDKRAGNGKHGLNERMSELTQARKTAEAKAEAETAARVRAEAEAAELRAKLVSLPLPRKETPAAADAAPTREQFSSDQDYYQALTEYRVDQRLAERDRETAEAKEKASQTARLAGFQKRMADAKAANPEFEAKLAASNARVSDQVREAILDSEVGPKILEHFADHPEDAERIAGLTVGGALREIGKLEARLEAPAKQGTVTPEPKADAKVEISRAPEPINPLRGNGAAVEEPINSKGEFVGDFATWKRLRKEGKIK